jgi:hypothetical protein
LITLTFVDDAFGVAVGRRLREVAEQLLLPGADAFGERVERGESGMVDCEIERVEALLGVCVAARPVDVTERFF